MDVYLPEEVDEGVNRWISRDICVFCLLPHFFHIHCVIQDVRVGDWVSECVAVGRLECG